MIFQFSRAGVDYKVVIDEPGTDDYIQVDKKNGTLLIHEVDWVNISKKRKVIKVVVLSYFNDQLGNLVKGSGSNDSSFNAVEQESWLYFYLPSRNGEQLSKMIINGILIANYGFMIFDAEGNFYPPIWFTTQIEETGQQVAIEGGTVYQKTGGNVTVTVSEGAGDVYTYQLEGYPAQESNTFQGIPTGTYKLTVTSPLSMPWTQTIRI